MHFREKETGSANVLNNTHTSEEGDMTLNPYLLPLSSMLNERQQGEALVSLYRPISISVSKASWSKPWFMPLLGVAQNPS